MVSKKFVFGQTCQLVDYARYFFSLFAKIRSFMDHCCPGNLTAVENRTICVRLGGTLENLLQMFNFYIVNLTGVNKSYLLPRGGGGGTPIKSG